MSRALYTRLQAIEPEVMSPMEGTEISGAISPRRRALGGLFRNDVADAPSRLQKPRVIRAGIRCIANQARLLGGSNSATTEGI